MAFMNLAVSGVMLAGFTSAAAVSARQDAQTVTVDLSVDRGVPDHLGSGVLLGIPDNQWPGMSADQIPDSFYERIGFRYNRGGGSQLPDGAWITGLDGYYARLNSTYSDYQKTRSFGAPYIIIPHDLWGTEQSGQDDPWPGDNGDWTDYENFLDQLLNDLVRLDMLGGLSWDIWNEPDVDIFWKRSIEQWVELYVRTHRFIRARPELDAMEIMGPAMQIGPTADNPWWTAWLTAVSEEGIPPDQYSYHLLYAAESIEADRSDIDLQLYNQTFQELLDQYDLPLRQINVNEYAIPEEQTTSTSAWYIARFERYDTFGSRANWRSACQLHDFLANLVTKPGAPDASECGDTGYAFNGQGQMYAYYGRNMTGRRAASDGSEDRSADAFATVGEDRVRILFGTRGRTGTWQLSIDGLESVGLPTDGEMDVRTYAFVDDGLYGVVDGPEDRGSVARAVTGGSVQFEVVIQEVDLDTAFAFEFDVGTGSEGYPQ